jgi:hypothetical protein
MKNRHIYYQLLRANKIIQSQSEIGWFCLDIFSDSDNDKSDEIANASFKLKFSKASFKLKFSKLNGDGFSKYTIILKDGSNFIIGGML